MRKCGYTLLLLVLLVFLHVKPALALASFPPGVAIGLRSAPYYDNNILKMSDEVSQCKAGNSVSLGCYILTNMTYFSVGGAGLILGMYDANNKPVLSGAAQFFAQGIDTMASVKPASSIDYIAYEVNRLRVPGTPEAAYAAGGGYGFNSLAPVLNIWTSIRNLAYIIFAIIFIVIGVMIMLRIKIDPKTVATIQNALPKIIFALILVTFSYAIAGFLIDIMYVLIALILTLIKNTTGLPSFLGITTYDYVSEVVNNKHTVFQFAWAGLASTTIASVSVFSLAQNLMGPAAGTLPGIAGALTFLILAIAILWALFKTWLMLLGAYANIILGVLFAPLQLMLDAIPGQNQFSSWVRNMLANLLAFPFVIVLMTIGTIIAVNTGNNFGSGGGGFVPPLIGGGNSSSANNQLSIQALIAIGIFLTIPKGLSIMQEVLKAPPFKYGSAWAEALNWARNPFGLTNTAVTAGRFEAANMLTSHWTRVDPNDPTKFLPPTGWRGTAINIITPRRR